jgi:hypothetical protein
MRKRKDRIDPVGFRGSVPTSSHQWLRCLTGWRPPWASQPSVRGAPTTSFDQRFMDMMVLHGMGAQEAEIV